MCEYRNALQLLGSERDGCPKLSTRADPIILMPNGQASGHRNVDITDYNHDYRYGET
jgi:hypothetical protein